MSVLPLSSINFLCPNDALVPANAQNSVPAGKLYENLWIVDKTSYDACSVDTSISSNRRILTCDTPLTLKRFLMVFQQFSATPEGLEFQPGQEYYFIGTSDGSMLSLGATSGGHCTSHKMKISIYVCTGSSDVKCQPSVGLPSTPFSTEPPTTPAPTTAAPPACASSLEVQAIHNQTSSIPSINSEVNKISDLILAIQSMKQQMDTMSEKLENCTSRPAYIAPTSSPPTTVAPTTPVPVRESCKAHYLNGVTTSGIYKVDPGNQGNAFDVYCDQGTDGGGWGVFQNRFDGKVNFQKGWNDYVSGFGNLFGEFWLGLDKIHRLTSPPVTLRVDLTAADGETRLALFDGFSVGNGTDKYTLTCGTYVAGASTAGDSLCFSNGYKFSTYDQDNDGWTGDGQHCAQMFKGAWWHQACHESSLNGVYRNGSHPSFFADGIIWKSWKGYTYSYMKTRMMIRP
ncbi:techylectin-5A isoform X3 [Nematostella vectensis]|nr:techylectin-5A isoform X3 [Nematostella vectensis]